jgi:hypothetical protein
MKQDTLESFAKKFPAIEREIQNRINKLVLETTEKTFKESQSKVPVLGGTLLNSGIISVAKPTQNGYESLIEYTAPYSAYVHNGTGPLRPVGTQVKIKGATYTKLVEGERNFLGSSIKNNFNNEYDEKILNIISEVYTKI